MPKYRFVVQSPSGKMRRGTISEKDESAAKQSLLKAGFQVVSVTEVTDLIVHSPAAAPGGRARLAPERASIIEFEESLGEKLWTALSTYVLRREVALLLAVAGVIWLVVGALQTRGPEAPPELEYKVVKVSVEVDTKGYLGNTLEIRLPELPFKERARVEADSDELQKAELEIETAVVPSKAQVSLLDGERVLATAEGLLEASSVAGEYTFHPELVKVKSE